MSELLTSDTQRARSPFYADTRFASLRIMRGVSPESIERHVEHCIQKHIEAGEVLLSPDTVNHNVYAVLHGSLAVYLTPPDADGAAALTRLGPGSCAGEMSIIEDTDPSAWVVAEEPTQVLVIDQSALWGLINSSHAFARNLLVVLSERLRADNEVIADSESLLRRYQRSAVTDALTEVFNRHWMDDMFRRKLHRCGIDGQDVCLVMIDVDFFKSYNDRHGHLAGDNALCVIADTLRSHFRPTDMVARYGGDEFSVMLPATRMAEALEIAERVRAAVGGPPGERNSLDDGAGLTVSLGIAVHENDESLEALLARADAALYRAKLAGRNCVSE